MKSISSQEQLRLVALGYAAVFVVAATVLYGRHLQELRYPAEASGGMWAFGDALLYIFIACLFMLPTIFLLFVIAKFENFYRTFSKLLLGLSLSAPICLSLFFFGKTHVAESLGNVCLVRLFLSPFILVAIGVSRLVARFDRAKRLISYAFLVEGLTFGVVIVVTAVSLFM